jgi:hypothetical protein
LIRLAPSKPTKIGPYDLDCVVIEEGDFRLEVGDGLVQLCIVPIEPNGRLRLITLGPVVSHQSPALVADPYAVEYSESWSGDLGKLGGATLTSVRVSMTNGSYRCECTTTKRMWIASFEP